MLPMLSFPSKVGKANGHMGHYRLNEARVELTRYLGLPVFRPGPLYTFLGCLDLGIPTYLVGR